MRILFIRHGDPDYQLDSLTERGKIEANLLGEKFKHMTIDKAYVSPLGRAKLTCQLALQHKDIEPIECEFLTEFRHLINLPYQEKPHLIWDLLPSYWTQKQDFYSKDNWHKDEQFEKSEIFNKYQNVCQQFDKILFENGYERQGALYKVNNSNQKTLAFFCHFGIEAILLSHIFNCSPMIILHSFVALPSSVTTILTEERRQGIASLRCQSFGDTSHLFKAGIQPSKMATFCDVFDSDERH